LDGVVPGIWLAAFGIQAAKRIRLRGNASGIGRVLVALAEKHFVSGKKPGFVKAHSPFPNGSCADLLFHRRLLVVKRNAV
jgi:hypothetical protein